MASLLDLAPEILIHIVRAVSRSNYKYWMDSDLYRLARTCRTLYNVTEPFLYTRYIQNNLDQLSKFLRTILEKPKYASRMKMIYLEQMSKDEYSDEGDEEGDDGDKAAGLDYKENRRSKELPLLVEAYEKYRIPPSDAISSEQWISALASRKIQALFALVLLSVPNLESFSICTDSASRDRLGFLSGAFIRASQSSDRFLCKLKEITYSHAYPEASINFEDAKAFFYLPSLQRLEINSLAVDQDFAWSPPLTTCNIEELDLPSSGVDNDAWPTLLHPMRNLKHFSYNPGNPKHVGFMAMDPMGLGEGLAAVKNTLESLTLSDFYLQGEEDDLLGSLHDFPKLKKLEIQISLLIGAEEGRSEKQLWELLPPALEEGTFWGEDGLGGYGVNSRADTLDQIVEVVMRKESHFPGLRRISILDFEGGEVEALREICIARGVQYSG